VRAENKNPPTEFTGGFEKCFLSPETSHLTPIFHSPYISVQF